VMKMEEYHCIFCEKQPSNIILFLLQQNLSVLQNADIGKALPFHYIHQRDLYVMSKVLLPIAEAWSEAAQSKGTNRNLLSSVILLD